jgi:hypothetical protein
MPIAGFLAHVPEERPGVELTYARTYGFDAMTFFNGSRVYESIGFALHRASKTVQRRFLYSRSALSSGLK